MNFNEVHIKGIKADIAKHEITITFVADMDDENMDTAEQLSAYVDADSSSVDITIIPMQPPLFDHSKEIDK